MFQKKSYPLSLTSEDMLPLSGLRMRGYTLRTLVQIFRFSRGIKQPGQLHYQQFQLILRTKSKPSTITSSSYLHKDLRHQVQESKIHICNNNIIKSITYRYVRKINNVLIKVPASLKQQVSFSFINIHYKMYFVCFFKNL